MNARELLDEDELGLETHLDTAYGEDTCQTILRALRLLAAAESNDGTTPETDANAAYAHFPDDYPRTDAALAIDADFCRAMERERNGLAARVGELEKDAERIAWIQMVAAMAESENQDEVNEADEVGNQLREQFIVNGHNLRAAIDAARSKP